MKRYLPIAGVLLSTAASASSLSVDSFIQTKPGEFAVYVTARPDDPHWAANIDCFLLRDGKPVDKAVTTIFHVTGPTRASLSLRGDQPGTPTVQCRVEFY